MLTWGHNIHILPNTQDGCKQRQAVVSFLLAPNPKSLFPSKLPAVHACCFLRGSSSLFSHISQSILWPFCCWLPPRRLPLFPNKPSCFPPVASAETWVVDRLARSLGEKIRPKHKIKSSAASPLNSHPQQFLGLQHNLHPSSHPLFGGWGSCRVLSQLPSAPSVGGMQFSLRCWSSKSPPGHRHTPLNWLKMKQSKREFFEQMLWDYGAHVTAVTTHSSLLQNRNTESKNHSLQKLKNNKKCSSKYEIKAYGYFLHDLLQRKRGSLQDTTE